MTDTTIPEPATYPHFPLDAYSETDACPNCHGGPVQLAEETTRYWRGLTVEEGTLFAYDDTTADDGDDPRIECICCGQRWAVPQTLEYG